MGFQQGLSGLNAASKSLDVIGNNISNANTVGFKQAQVQFADVYANSLSGASANAVGIGVKVSTIAQQFTQGNISSTNNPLDIAINGNGFFRLSTNGAVTYSRNGQFQLDKNGDIVNAQGAHLTGYIADSNGVLSTGSAAPININTADIAPAQTSKISGVMNLDSREYVPGTQKPVTIPPVITPIAFSPTDPTSYNKSTSVTVFDSLGNSHVVQTYYVRIDPVTTPPAVAGSIEWNVFSTVDGNRFDAAGVLTPPANPATPIGKLAFDNMGKLIGANPPHAPTDPRALHFRVPVASGAVTPINTTADIRFDYTNSTQFGSDFSVSSMKQDGFTSGKLSKFNTSKDGTIVGSYTNGQTKVLGQVVLASFTNSNGLQSLGDNQWAETSASGQSLVGPPNSGNLGALTASATEDSNTDLTGELVSMITAQRVYQANAQTIKTQDQVLQTIVNLR
ncbi:flagellar hook protein FlgE [Undibacterium crateris]|uniref:flagellar hook protein FlgE n=1 Tax=Undibacterium crateris TaxID=2528175 RepID=UPI0013896369|nr:flagellar hook protein FlgE [Undibacterium crateris]NDI86784.1 flagellar hook-basal body complex protein [Undibacterium crateris]